MANPPSKGKVAGALGGGAVIAAILASVFRLEGGYVNNPKDPGGETNMGITKAVAVRHGYTGPMRELTKDKASAIYIEDYIKRPGFMPLVEVDPAVLDELVDTAVNMGPPRPSRWFQQSLNELNRAGVTVDAKVGANTIRAYRVYQGRVGRVAACVSMLDSLDAKQAAEYARLIRANPSLRVFGKGWLKNRIGNVDRAHCRKGAA